MKVSEFLIEAKGVISKSENWAQGSYARDSAGVGVDTSSGRATCFCSLGAIEVVRWDSKHRGLPVGIAGKAAYQLGRVMGGISKFNDSNSHEDVMAKWDEAIEAAKAVEDFQ